MAELLPARELRNHNARVLAEVSAGRSFVVTKEGVPVADLTPHVEAAATPPRFAPAEALAGVFVGPWPDAAGWLEEIRQASDGEPQDPWDRG